MDEIVQNNRRTKYILWNRSKGLKDSIVFVFFVQLDIKPENRQWDVTPSTLRCTSLKLADKSDPLFPSRDEELPGKGELVTALLQKQRCEKMQGQKTQNFMLGS